MKGRNPTKAEKVLWDRMAALGCVACRKDGRSNPWVSIHHIDGRTKPGANERVLALCSEHHQHTDLDPMKRIGVHPFIARFENKYGRQLDLLAECMEMIGK